MSRAVFSTAGKFVNRVDRCPDCGAKKLALDKRCAQCQIRRKAEAGDEQSVTNCNELDRWAAVDKFMAGVR